MVPRSTSYCMSASSRTRRRSFEAHRGPIATSMARGARGAAARSAPSAPSGKPRPSSRATSRWTQSPRWQSPCWWGGSARLPGSRGSVQKASYACLSTSTRSRSRRNAWRVLMGPRTGPPNRVSPTCRTRLGPSTSLPRHCSATRRAHPGLGTTVCTSSSTRSRARIESRVSTIWII